MQPPELFQQDSDNLGAFLRSADAVRLINDIVTQMKLKIQLTRKQ